MKAPPTATRSTFFHRDIPGGRTAFVGPEGGGGADSSADALVLDKPFEKEEFGKLLTRLMTRLSV